MVGSKRFALRPAFLNYGSLFLKAFQCEADRPHFDFRTKTQIEKQRVIVLWNS